MKANKNFIDLPQEFWAYVKYLSQKIGYTQRKSQIAKAPSIEEIKKTLKNNDLFSTYLFESENKNTMHGNMLIKYFEYRADILNKHIEPRLMDVKRARSTYEYLIDKLSPTCTLPMNKQKGEKRTPAYLTCIINMIIEAHFGHYKCDFEPRELTYFTENGKLIRTLSRRVDGAFPSISNPVALWEIKEYYYATTFGSRVADGIYESILDGYELMELRTNRGMNCDHLLMIDGYYTWWNLGRSYLCRIIDMLHMGFVDEVLFGYEVVEELPQIVESWKSKFSEKISR